MNTLQLDNKKLANQSCSSDLPILNSSIVRTRTIFASLFVFVFVVATVDFSTYALNPASFYSLPAYLAATTLRPAKAIAVTVLLVIITYGGLFLGPWADEIKSYSQMFYNFRCINRTLIAAAMVIITQLTLSQRRFDLKISREIDLGDLSDERYPIYITLLTRVRFFVTLLIALTLTASLAIVDINSPLQINMPILYTVPLLLCILSGRILTVWVMLPLLLVCSWIGWTGDASMDTTLAHRALINRSFACAALFFMTVVAHFTAPRDNAI